MQTYITHQCTQRDTSSVAFVKPFNHWPLGKYCGFKDIIYKVYTIFTTRIVCTENGLQGVPQNFIDDIIEANIGSDNIKGILPKGPYPPCLRNGWVQSGINSLGPSDAYMRQ